MYYTTYTINILIFSYFKFRYKQIAWLRRPTSALKENVSKEFKSTLYRNPYKEQQRPYTTPARPSDADAQPKQGRGTASSGGGAGPRRPAGARLVEDDTRREEQEEEDDDHQNQEEEQEADAK